MFRVCRASYNQYRASSMVKSYGPPSGSMGSDGPSMQATYLSAAGPLKFQAFARRAQGAIAPEGYTPML